MVNEYSNLETRTRIVCIVCVMCINVYVWPVASIT